MPKVLFSVKTKRGSNLDVYSDGGRSPFSPSNIVNGRIFYNNKLGLNNERAQPDQSYNCHGLTLIGRLGWFETNSNILTILNDNGFKSILSVSNISREKILDTHNILPGDVVIYKQANTPRSFNITHTCTIYNVHKFTLHRVSYLSLRALSKLGQMGEYFHKINNSYITSIYGNTIEIWSNSI